MISVRNVREVTYARLGDLTKSFPIKSANKDINAGMAISGQSRTESLMNPAVICQTWQTGSLPDDHFWQNDKELFSKVGQ